VLLATFMVAFLGYLTSRKGVRLQGRSAELDRKERLKAYLNASIVREEPKESGPRRGMRNEFLEIKNSGPSAARDIGVWVDGVAIGDHPHITTFRPDIPALAPGSSVRFLLLTPAGVPPPADVRIEWVDAGDERDECQTSFGTDLWVG